MKLTLIACAVISAVTLMGCNENSSHSSEEKSTTEPSKKVHLDADQPEINITELYTRASKTLFKQRALEATMYGLSSEEVGQEFAGLLADFSPENEAKLRKELAKISSQINHYTLTNATNTAIDNQQVMSSITQYYAGHQDFPIGYIDVWMGLSPFIVNQINGPLIDIPRIMQNDQAITTEQEALNYIARLEKFDQMIASIEEKLAFDTAQNWLPPKSTVTGALRYLVGFTKVEPKDHVFVTNFTDKISQIPSLSTQQKQSLTEQVIEKVTKVVYPAYRSIAKVTAQLAMKARKEAGVWAQPNGEAYYQEAIRQLGDSALTANEIHQVGLDEVTRISKAMHSILTEQGYTQGTVGARMVALNNEKRFLYQDSKAGREMLLADLNGYISEITQKMAPIFKTKPSYEVQVRAFPVEIQDGAPGGQYSPPAVDGSKPGIYWINLRDMKANPKFSLKTLTYHEANPGHHWQVALNMDQASLPFLRRIAPYNAYVEGWALYSEQVASELGLYDNDPFGDLGRLQAELFRAVRLVVDTGMHHKRWTREQAIQYMSEITGSAESDVVAEIERYITWPGQALGYKLGMLKILALREHAKAKLGEKFNLAEFHDVVLLGGAVPMAVLDRNVNQWIANKG
ncbi:hypothetical protein NBRC116592_25630 [Colwellia sp. KU-HH00111]|uniref:DUF885 domain-containing protein n=1 Tax=Colwellia sp. KU-HH00111 TaxID=3127652 RepID=UPI00310A6DB2